MALPLIPRDKIETAFEETLKKASDPIKPLFRYFRAYWMTKVKIDLWHVSDLNVRTNNAVEGESSPVLCDNLHASFRLEPSLQSSSVQIPSECMALFWLRQAWRGVIPATDIENANRWRKEEGQKGSRSSKSSGNTRINVRSGQNGTEWSSSRTISTYWRKEVICSFFSLGFLYFVAPFPIPQ